MRAFESEKKILKGEKREWSYEELTGNLQVAPLTWLPALLIRVVSLCVIQKVFKDDAALLRIVNKAVTDARDENGVLRGDKS